MFLRRSDFLFASLPLRGLPRWNGLVVEVGSTTRHHNSVPLPPKKDERLVGDRKDSAGVSGRGRDHQHDRHDSLDNIRNIGIIAHIDAGKTTTSERMLFYAGYTHRLGNVDRGDTVLDYLPTERERGITITAAAITFPWAGHRLTLIDTPGHVDFGIEVARSLRVLDGAITILDGRAGVQAQTRTVWRQAETFSIPRLIYVNKMDKVGADWRHALTDIHRRLVPGPQPIPIQLPIVGGERTSENEKPHRSSGNSSSSQAIGGGIMVIADLVGKRWLRWTDDLGQSLVETPWTMEDPLWTEITRERQSMVEALASLDDELLERYLNDPQGIGETDLHHSLRQLTLAGKIAPVLAGSSLANRGVQPLLDAIIRYLPSPRDRPLPILSSSSSSMQLQGQDVEHFLGLAFKVYYEEGRGMLVYVRVYTGHLTAMSVLRNCTGQVRERPTRLMIAHADRLEEVSSVGPGQVAVLLGLRHTATGDTLVEEAHAQRLHGRLVGIPIPTPVFTRVVEPLSANDEPVLEEALARIQREDPSVQVTRDPETGERHLGGMGELHLEIVEGRLRNDMRVRAHFGPVRIAYKETLKLPPGRAISWRRSLDRTLPSGRRLQAALTMSIRAREELDDNDINLIMGESTEDPVASEGRQRMKSRPPAELVEALRDGIKAALQSGPLAALPLVGLSITITEIAWTLPASTPEAFHYLSHAMLTGWLHQLRRQAGKEGEREEERGRGRGETSFLEDAFAASTAGPSVIIPSALVEPIMRVEITVPLKHLGPTLNDLIAGRRATIISTSSDEDQQGEEDEKMRDTTILANVPLVSLLGYSNELRSRTSGAGSFSMHPCTYQVVPAGEEARLRPSRMLL